MRDQKTLFALGALSALVLACSNGPVAPTASDSGALTLSAPLLMQAQYGLSLQALDIGIHSQDDQIVARDGGAGVSAVGSWRTTIRYSGGPEVEASGPVTCFSSVDGNGARVGGVVNNSTDPSMIGAEMVANLKDGSDDWSSGVRIQPPGSTITALAHCQSGFSNLQIGVNGRSTFRKIGKGFVFIVGIL